MSPAQIAEWAMPVFAAAPGNELCMKIIEGAAEKTAMLTASVFRKGGFSCGEALDIAESGSLFKNGIFESSFQKRLTGMLPEGNYRFHRFDGTPAEDGIRLAMKMAEKGNCCKSG